LANVAFFFDLIVEKFVAAKLSEFSMGYMSINSQLYVIDTLSTVNANRAFSFGWIFPIKLARSGSKDYL